MTLRPKLQQARWSYFFVFQRFSLAGKCCSTKGNWIAALGQQHKYSGVLIGSDGTSIKKGWVVGSHLYIFPQTCDHVTYVSLKSWRDTNMNRKLCDPHTHKAHRYLRNDTWHAFVTTHDVYHVHGSWWYKITSIVTLYMSCQRVHKFYIISVHMISYSCTCWHDSFRQISWLHDLTILTWT
jgi:hypothetical protein